MSQLFEGDFEGRCTKIEFGGDKNGKPIVRGQMTIVGGPKDGTTVPYDGKLDEKNIKYTKQHLVALGWQGKDIRTLVDDVASANKSVPFRVRIARWEKPEGGVKEWISVDSIGFTARPLEKLDNAKLNDVNGWFAQAEDGAIPF